jgi:hypothetical protein
MNMQIDGTAITLNIVGLGILAYSPKLASHIKEGKITSQLTTAQWNKFFLMCYKVLSLDSAPGHQGLSSFVSTVDILMTHT